MTETDIEIILERAKERYPEVGPRVISDNGPQFIAKDFKEFIRLSGMTHVRTSPYYPQSNGKIEVGTNHSKGSAFGPGRHCRWKMRGVWFKGYVAHYNNVRLNSAIGYITPKDILAGSIGVCKYAGNRLTSSTIRISRVIRTFSAVRNLTPTLAQRPTRVRCS